MNIEDRLSDLWRSVIDVKRGFKLPHYFKEVNMENIGSVTFFSKRYNQVIRIMKKGNGTYGYYYRNFSGKWTYYSSFENLILAGNFFSLAQMRNIFTKIKIDKDK